MSATARGMGRMLALYGVIVGGSPSLAASLVGGEWRCARLLAEVPFEEEVAIAAG